MFTFRSANKKEKERKKKKNKSIDSEKESNCRKSPSCFIINFVFNLFDSIWRCRSSTQNSIPFVPAFPSLALAVSLLLCTIMMADTKFVANEEGWSRAKNNDNEIKMYIHFGILSFMAAPPHWLVHFVCYTLLPEIKTLLTALKKINAKKKTKIENKKKNTKIKIDL